MTAPTFVASYETSFTTLSFTADLSITTQAGSAVTVSNTDWNTIYDAGSVGSKTVGPSTPTGQKYSIVAVETYGARRVA